MMIAILSTLLFAAAGLTAMSVILVTLHDCRDQVRALRSVVRSHVVLHTPVMRADVPLKAVRTASWRPTIPHPAFATWPSLAA